jgi:ribonucleoside-diphosphate reductase beta chain
MTLRYELQPFRDYQLAKKYRWDPAGLDFTRDVRDWAALSERERDVMLNLLSMFINGEEAVATDLTPLLWAVGRQGGLREEEMFLTTQLFDESQHVEFFDRWLAEVVTAPIDRAAYYGPSYRAIFFDELPAALTALLADPSPRAQARAMLVYHMIVEGVLAETGYEAAFIACKRRGILPGLVQGFEHIKRDESRHIAYGLHALARILQAEPGLWDEYNATLNALLAVAIGVIPEALERYGEDIPFGISVAEMTAYAMEQFGKRYGVLERCAKSLAPVS